MVLTCKYYLQLVSFLEYYSIWMSSFGSPESVLIGAQFPILFFYITYFITHMQYTCASQDEYICMLVNTFLYNIYNFNELFLKSMPYSNNSPYSINKVNKHRVPNLYFSTQYGTNKSVFCVISNHN